MSLSLLPFASVTEFFLSVVCVHRQARHCKTLPIPCHGHASGPVIKSDKESLCSL